MKRNIIAVATILLLIPAYVIGGGKFRSIWARRKPAHVYLFADTQARHAGDLLTILVNENTDISNQDQRTLSKDSRLGAGFDFSGTAGGDVGSAAGTASAAHTANSQREFNGNTRFSTARGFTDRVTVTVVQVFPNGNMFVSGQRRVFIEGDERTLSISGVVRPIDVRADNTVESRFVGELRMDFRGCGAETKFANQGWLSKRMNRFWPF